MAKKLIIAEKPSVAADIARALGGFTRKGDYFESEGYVLSSAVGHLLERVETVVRTMLADEGVRLPGAKRFGSQKRARAEGLEIPDDLLAKIEKLCTT